MKAIAMLQRRIRLMLGRGLARLIDDAGGLQVVQVQMLDDEVRELEHYQPYGLAYYAPDGGEPVYLAPDGVRANAMLVAIAHRQARLKGLAKGEVAMYTDEGDVIHFKRGRIVEIVAGAKIKITSPEVEVIASTKVTITSPLTAISQDVTIGGTLDVAGAVAMHATANVTGMATVGGLASTGAAGASTVAGNLNISGGNVTADGIGLKTHVHGGVQTGGGTTGVPQ